MVGTTSYQIVVFTHQHSISGGIFLHEQRLSDFLKDRRDTNVIMHNASVARLEDPANTLVKTLNAIIPKDGIVLAFEPAQKVPTRNFINYPKERYEVYLILDGMEARGNVHLQGSLDLRRVLADAGHSFLPVTDATVSIEANPNILLKREAILVNADRIRFIGQVQPKPQTGPITPVPSGD